jgi:hypothetical protein
MNSNDARFNHGSKPAVRISAPGHTSSQENLYEKRSSVTSVATSILKLIVALPVTLTASQGADLLPAPTGPHKTGRMSFHWKDAAAPSWRRARPTTSAS